MFFLLSKLFWLFANPLSLSILLAGSGFALSLLRLRRAAVSVSALGFLVLAFSCWTTLGAIMLHPLEERFSRPSPAPADVDGIVVLGGGFEGGVNRVRGGYELNGSGDRFVETAVLARRYPAAKVLVSGGTGTLFLDGEGDADTAPRLLQALGVARERLILEGRSRNTDENARFSAEIARPLPGETWLLVTSAFHMPRSVALFRKAGFPIVPWPADYRTAGDEGFGLARDNAFDSLQITAIAIREWIGLIAYRLTGRTDTLLPAP